MKWLKLWQIEENKAADLLDSLADKDSSSTPPPGEFEKIITDMDRRGIKTRLGKQLKWRNLFKNLFQNKK